MSTRLTQALEFANYRVTLNNQQAALRAKTQSLLSYSINGGTFSINMQLINFCKLLLDQGQQEAVLLDIYQNPIKITVQSFYDEIFSRYIEVTNDYYVEYEKLRKSRKVHRVLDLNDSGE
jgi:hypothetical protein